MTIASTPSRNRAVIALWRAYHRHANEARISRDAIEGWSAELKRHHAAIETNDKAAMECLDILSQIGEDVSRIPSAEDIGHFEKIEHTPAEHAVVNAFEIEK